jgi:hypothetical protein
MQTLCNKSRNNSNIERGQDMLNKKSKNGQSLKYNNGDSESSNDSSEDEEADPASAAR